MPAEIHPETVSDIATTVARPFSALHWVFREETLTSLDFTWKTPLFYLTKESNCGRWASILLASLFNRGLLKCNPGSFLKTSFTFIE
jgi:hypothetical protein